MKNKLLRIVLIVFTLLLPKLHFGAAPNLGTAANYVLFSTVGAVGNTGISQITGNVGANSGAITGFGNVNGVMVSGGIPGGQCAADVLSAYTQLNTAVPDYFVAPLLGNGQIFTAGVYSVSGPATLNLNLILDAQGNPNAVFIIQIPGTFSTNANSKIQLVNGAKACNVFWKTEGLISMAPGTFMRGTMIANNAAINMSTNDTLEGRALTTAGAVNVSGVMAYTPIGCGSPVLTGPAAPALGDVACYALFSSIGPVTNVGITNVIGDVGSNNGLTTGFNPLFVTGAIHPIPDGSTLSCKNDLLGVYTYLNTLTYDIELLYPAQFGNSLVLTPHTYLLNAAVTFTDTLFLNAQGNPNAVFVFQVKGAFSTNTYSKVILKNGAQAKNVFWMVDGAVNINDYSIFNGTIICNNGAIDLKIGVDLKGRALTTTGALTTSAITAAITPGCGAVVNSILSDPNNQTLCAGDSATFIVVAEGSGITYQWRKGNVDLVNGPNISGANSDTLIINPVMISDSSSYYNVFITGTPNDTSAYAILAVNTAPAIVTEPTNQSACENTPAVFSVVSTGAGLNYQWRKGSSNLVNGTNISGANTNTLTLDSVNVSDASSNYNVVVTGACLKNDTSVFVSLVVNTAANITTQPLTQTICAAGKVQFFVEATGKDLTYQWRKGNVDLMISANITDATSDTLTIDIADVADTSSYYNVVITGACVPSDTSVNVALIMATPPNITTQPVNQLVCEGSTAVFSVLSTGNQLTYQWKKGNTNLVDNLYFSGVNTATLTVDSANVSDTSSYYHVVISGVCAPSISSDSVSLKIITLPVITTEPSNQTVCSNTSANFSVVAIGDALTYKWKKGNVDLVNNLNVSGVNTASLTFNAATIADTSSYYNVVVSGTCLPKDTSVFVSLNITTQPVIATQPSDVILCANSSANFSIVATGSALTYQWRKGNVNMVDDITISGSNSANLVINPAVIADTSSYYNVIVSGTCLPKDTSIDVALIMNASPLIVTQPIDQTICEGSTVSFSVVATGVGLSYQWKKGNVDVVDDVNISGSTTATLTFNAAMVSDSSSYYNVVVTGSCIPALTSVDVVLLVNPSINIEIQPINQSVCVNALSTISVNATGTNLTYQWRKGNSNLADDMNISGSTTSTLTINSTTVLDTAYNYNVVISGTCSADVVSSNVSLYITEFALPITGNNSPLCAGNALNLSAQTVLGCTYAWSGPDGYTSADQNPILLSISNLHAGLYSVVLSKNGCVSLLGSTSVFVNNCDSTDLLITKTVDNFTPIVGSKVTFTLVATNAGPENASGVVVNELLQSGYHYVSSATTAGNYNATTGVWTVGTLNKGESAILSITAVVNATGSYTNTADITGTETDGNLLNNTITIETTPVDFFIPEGFSPNGDGINDLFVIRGILNYPNNDFEIFNRWGDKVYSTSNYQNTWNGTSTLGLRFGGDNLQVGTYFYVLDLKNGNGVYKGTIYLNN